MVASGSGIGGRAGDSGEELEDDGMQYYPKRKSAEPHTEARRGPGALFRMTGTSAVNTRYARLSLRRRRCRGAASQLSFSQGSDGSLECESSSQDAQPVMIGAVKRVSDARTRGLQHLLSLW